MRIEGTNSVDSLNNHFDFDKKINKKTIVFEDFYKTAMGLINQTNTIQKEANQIGLDFITGKTDNIHNVMIAQEKANVALQFTVQINNKVLDAYNEIMRITL